MAAVTRALESHLGSGRVARVIYGRCRSRSKHCFTDRAALGVIPFG
jgi:hypothetical protein